MDFKGTNLKHTGRIHLKHTSRMDLKGTKTKAHKQNTRRRRIGGQGVTDPRTGGGGGMGLNFCFPIAGPSGPAIGAHVN